MRGKGGLSACFLTKTGITPAHAGKRKKESRRTGAYKDHPRTCGEKPLNPPRRGARGDHPRTCGEKITSIFVGVGGWGSPPHMRGKGMYELLKQYERRITPAHAGKSHKSRKSSYCTRDHPRTCGEKYERR